MPFTIHPPSTRRAVRAKGCFASGRRRIWLRKRLGKYRTFFNHLAVKLFPALVLHLMGVAALWQAVIHIAGPEHGLSMHVERQRRCATPSSEFAGDLTVGFHSWHPDHHIGQEWSAPTGRHRAGPDNFQWEKRLRDHRQQTVVQTDVSPRCLAMAINCSGVLSAWAIGSGAGFCLRATGCSWSRYLLDELR